VSEDPRIRALESASEAETEFAEALDRGVRVVIAPGGEAWARQLIAICLCDLLGRLLPAIEIVCDPKIRAHGLLPPGSEFLAKRLAEGRCDSMIEPTAGLVADPALTAVIGADGEGDIFLDGSGWVSYLGDRPVEPLTEDEVNPIGPLSAACRGAAEVIRRLLGALLPAASSGEPSYWSALTMAPCKPEEVGEWPALAEPRVEALLMGAGSIGGASAYTLARVPRLAGKLPIIDFDALEARNSRKALLARRADIERGAGKAEVAAAELEYLIGLDAPTVNGTLAAHVAARAASEPLPLVLCAVDSIEARRELADHMPLEVVNAACGATEIIVSGHRTDAGPCVYCLYIERVLDAEATRARMMARELGLPAGMIVELRVSRAGLESQHLRQIEQRRELPPGALANFRGRTLDDLFDEQVLYGEVRLEDEEGRRAALQLPFVPALAGVLLAGEALKHGSGAAFEPFQLGPSGLAIEYAESLLQRPVGMLSNPPRWPTSECLCRSPRRLALMRERYQLAGA
jgi:molybdopterin/thiamine biosynthesis adenylyltransferase